MIKIYVNHKRKTASFCVTLNNRDARKFLKNFEGEREYLFSKEEDEFSFWIKKCTSPKKYGIEVFSNGKDNYKKAVELMDGDI